MSSAKPFPCIRLSAGEVPAPGGMRLPAPQRWALVAMILAGPLTGSRRFLNPAAGRDRSIERRTVNALCKRRLLLLSPSQSIVRRYVLTPTGHWYARTICSAMAGDHFATTTGVAACPIEN